MNTPICDFARQYAESGVQLCKDIPQALQDIMYDPQTSGGLLVSMPKQYAQQFITELKNSAVEAVVIGYVTEKQDSWICLE
ncbi:MAG: hypothetical protein IKT63_00270 [Oscillospiraceae bacterium]|nr:hypothetical protein [Oscillospiraceae bacterium]